jgi:hypothetical protein
MRGGRRGPPQAQTREHLSCFVLPSSSSRARGGPSALAQLEVQAFLGSSVSAHAAVDPQQGQPDLDLTAHWATAVLDTRYYAGRIGVWSGIAAGSSISRITRSI